MYTLGTRSGRVYICSKCAIHTFIHHIFLIQVYRQYEYFLTLSGFLYTFLAKSSSKADLEQSRVASAWCEQTETYTDAQRWVLLLQRHPEPLPFGASSPEAVGKSLLFLPRCFSTELLQAVSSGGSFAKCLLDPGGGLPWRSQSPPAANWCPSHPPSRSRGWPRVPAVGSPPTLPCARAPGGLGLGTVCPPELLCGGLAQHLRMRLWAWRCLTAAGWPEGNPWLMGWVGELTLGGLEELKSVGYF